MKRSRFIADWIGVALMVSAGTLGCGSPRPDSLLLITIDTLRADHLSFWGHPVATSPVIDDLARSGTCFMNAFSASAATAPSTASILTGRYSSFHTVGLLNGMHRLQAGDETLATILGQRGMRTGAIVSNPVLGSWLGLDRGFDCYDDALEERELNRMDRQRLADRAVDLAIEWVESSGDEPFFLWLHLQDPHGPYTPKPEWDRVEELQNQEPDQVLPLGSDNSGHHAIPKYQRFHEQREVGDYVRRYDSEIAFTDHQLGRLFEFLDRQNLKRRTSIVLTADHGEAFGEDGFYFGHSHSVGLDQVHVPLVLAGPGVPCGVVVRTPVTNVAVAATVLDLLNIEAPPNMIGPSLLEQVGRQAVAATPVFFETLNQSGVALGNAFLRRDRKAADDREFWDRGNPNTAGFWKPLGSQLALRLDPNRPAVPQAAAEGLETELDGFDRDAAAARARLAPEKERARPGKWVSQMLRELGYVQ